MCTIELQRIPWRVGVNLLAWARWRPLAFIVFACALNLTVSNSALAVVSSSELELDLLSSNPQVSEQHYQRVSSHKDKKRKSKKRKTKKKKSRTPTKESCVLPRDDNSEQNDSDSQATDLDNLNWRDYGLFSRVRVYKKVAVESDLDVYKFELEQWSTVRVTLQTSGPLYANLYSIHPEMGWQSGFNHVVNAAGSSTASGGRFLPPGTWYLKIFREQVCKATNYNFTLITGSDNDNDGIALANDNCPNTSNRDQADYDDDNHGDACDPYRTACIDASRRNRDGVKMPLPLKAGDQQCKVRGTLNFGSNRKMHYWRNYPLNKTNPQITRAVIVVHGNSNTAWDYFNFIVDPAIGNGVLYNTLIIAPYFRDDQEPDGSGGQISHPSNHLVWSSQGWKDGSSSRSNYATPVMSSFSVMDKLIVDKIVGSLRFPNLEEIVLTGHSAGGQFVQRYAAAGRAEDQLASNIRMRYGIANPSSYMWLDNRRWVNGNWAVPSSPANYNNYKYGLAGIMGYLSVSNNQQLLPDRFISRDVWVLAGELEQNCECGVAATATNTDQCQPVPGLSSSKCKCCGTGCLACSAQAQAQGMDRFARATNFVRHLSDRLSYNAKFRVINNVAHEGGKMYKCGAGPAFLFGNWAQPDATCP